MTESVNKKFFTEVYFQGQSRTFVNNWQNPRTFQDCGHPADIHHIADDTNLLYLSKSLKDINKKINFDFKNIVHWFRANKISVSTSKTETILFRTKKIEIKQHINFRISGQKINIVKEAQGVF